MSMFQYSSLQSWTLKKGTILNVSSQHGLKNDWFPIVTTTVFPDLKLDCLSTWCCPKAMKYTKIIACPFITGVILTWTVNMKQVLVNDYWFSSATVGPTQLITVANCHDINEEFGI
jgi:hypothetical protein